MTPRPTTARRPQRSPAMTTRWLDALSTICIVGVVALLLLPTAPTLHPITPAVPVATTARNGLRTDSTGAQIVAGNVFSASRRAPTMRFVPPGTEPEPSASAMAAATSTAGAAPDDGPRLFGIIAEGSERHALLQLPGPDSVPRLVAVGDRRLGYRVVAIEADRVVVISSAGTRTIRLAPRTPSDSSENHS